ncbi:MAG: hypothetical protein AB7C90_03760 [Bacteroidales bacterium]
MNSKILVLAVVYIVFSAFAVQVAGNSNGPRKGFNKNKDLLLVQYDCKTDVDDLHAIAAFATLLSDSRFSKLKYHAVAGTYGIQGGLYVPPNPLFQKVFGENWSDAHNQVVPAVEKVKKRVKRTLARGGDIWIAEAGQSDFSAKLIAAIQKDLPQIKTKERIHLVQHSQWNEETTLPENLLFVKENADYQKIADGNDVGNGTPGFRDPTYTQWKERIKNSRLLEIWQLAFSLCNTYNGKEGRYTNPAIAAGGFDFSDLSEVCWILGLEDIKDTKEFFQLFAK